MPAAALGMRVCACASLSQHPRSLDSDSFPAILMAEGGVPDELERTLLRFGESQARIEHDLEHTISR